METKRARELEWTAGEPLPLDDLMAAQQPTILRSFARDWPLVAAGRNSPKAAMDYLRGFDAGRPVTGFIGAPEIGGRFAYDESVTGMNFTGRRGPLAEFFEQIAEQLDAPDASAIYIGSTDLDTFFPGLREANALRDETALFGSAQPIVSIWLGNRTTAAAHYDMSNNLACCMVGRRRFTLFPPEQVANLYPGPLEPTPGGQVITMVDFRAPDFDRYPRAREALAASEVAELEPGDVLFYPALWWHQVEALDGFNAMINYWWNPSPAFMDTPQNTLLHAMLSLRDRPEAEKRGWKALFDYYIFGDAEAPAAHLPDAARGNLAPMDEMKARRLRAMLLNRLNR